MNKRRALETRETKEYFKCSSKYHNSVEPARRDIASFLSLHSSTSATTNTPVK
jgi:hypothetical protein